MGDADALVDMVPQQVPEVQDSEVAEPEVQVGDGVSYC